MITYKEGQKVEISEPRTQKEHEKRVKHEFWNSVSGLRKKQLDILCITTKCIYVLDKETKETHPVLKSWLKPYRLCYKHFLDRRK